MLNMCSKENSPETDRIILKSLLFYCTLFFRNGNVTSLNELWKLISLFLRSHRARSIEIFVAICKVIKGSSEATTATATRTSQNNRI